MITDLFTIIRKEWNEMLLMRGSKRSGILYIVIMVAVFGIVMPLQSREQWFTVPLLPLVWSWMPVFMTTWMVSDAIAGERERHTLETLLASRLSDSAILFGKITAAVLYGFVLALANLLVGALTVNIANPNSSIHFYPLDFFGALLLFVLLGCLFIAGLGVLVSLRAATARQAYQKLAIVMMVIFVAPTIILQFLPKNSLGTLDTLLTNANYTQLLLIISLIFIIADLIMVAIARAKFQRPKLFL